jgi:hypothetical protein
MNEPNYNETVVIPLLQKKFQDLTNTNLILEANLLVEKEKNAYLHRHIDSIRGDAPRGDAPPVKKKKKDDLVIDGNAI